jgi:hypothetical protein
VTAAHHISARDEALTILATGAVALLLFMVAAWYNRRDRAHHHEGYRFAEAAEIAGIVSKVSALISIVLAIDLLAHRTSEPPATWWQLLLMLAGAVTLGVLSRLGWIHSVEFLMSFVCGGIAMAGAILALAGLAGVHHLGVLAAVLWSCVAGAGLGLVSMLMSFGVGLARPDPL